MKRYDEYQKVNLPWLSTIPSHWKLNRNKVFLHESKETVGENSKDFTLLSLTLNGIIPRDVASGKGKFPSDFSTYKVIQPNDMVFCLFDIDETPRTVGLSAHHGMLTGAYDVFHITGINIKYLLYYYLSLDNVKAMRPLYKGLRKTIGIDTFLGTKMPVPPRAEQDQIVRYLDWQVSKINRLIAAKRKQIKLILNQQQCIIEEAVLHGIEEMSHRAMPTTEWFGSIPANWQKRRIKYLFKLRDERNYLPLSEVNLISLYSKLGVIQNKDIEYKSGNRARNAEGYKKVCVDDMVVNIILCWMGAIGRSAYDGVTSPAYDVYEPRKGTFSRYYHYLFRLPKFGTECYKVGKGIMAMRWRVYSDQFCNIVAPVPPIEEQKRIAEWLDIKTARYAQSINAIEKQIAVLQELRTRLISDVVTGQIDVRGIEVPEHEIVEDTDTCEDSEEDTEGEEYEE